MERFHGTCRPDFLDQVEEADCGAVTAVAREALAQRARQHPKVIFYHELLRIYYIKFMSCYLLNIHSSVFYYDNFRIELRGVLLYNVMPL